MSITARTIALVIVCVFLVIAIGLYVWVILSMRTYEEFDSFFLIHPIKKIKHWLGKGQIMGQHKNNQTAKYAKEGLLPPKSPKMNKRDLECLITAYIESETGIGAIMQAVDVNSKI
jgi:hypothetical protein